MSIDQSTALLLSRVLHSEIGHGVKPVWVVYVTPYVRTATYPPRKAYSHIHTDLIYLRTATDMFYSFGLTPGRVDYRWSGRLVPLNDKRAMEPIGSLGKWLAASGKAAPNSGSSGPGMGNWLLNDTELRQRLIVYRLVQGKLIRAAEVGVEN